MVKATFNTVINVADKHDEKLRSLTKLAMFLFKTNAQKFAKK